MESFDPGELLKSLQGKVLDVAGCRLLEDAFSRQQSTINYLIGVNSELGQENQKLLARLSKLEADVSNLWAMTQELRAELAAQRSSTKT